MGRTFEQEFTEAVRRIDGNNSHVRTELTGYTGKPPGTGITHLGAWKLQNLTRGDTGQVSPFKHTTWYNIIVGGEAGIVSGL